MRFFGILMVLCYSVPLFGQTLTIALATAGQVEPFAPQSIVTAYGANLANGTAEASSLPLPTSIDGTTVNVNDAAGVGRLSNLFYVSPTQVNFEIPAGTAQGTATVTVTNQAGTSQTATIQIAHVSPGLFALNASGLVAAWALPVISGVQEPLLPVYQLRGSAIVPSPLDLGVSNEQVYLEMYGTGIRNAANVTVTVGGQSVPVLYAGAAPGYAGLDQVNIGPLPASLWGVAPIILRADGQVANTVSVTVQIHGTVASPSITSISPSAVIAVQISGLTGRRSAGRRPVERLSPLIR